MALELESTFENYKSKALEILNKNLKEDKIEVSETVKDNLCLHLALHITRELSGTYIPTSISQLKQLKQHEFYNPAKRIVTEMADYYHIKAHRSEIYYVTMYLAQMNLFDMDFNCEFDIYDDDVENTIIETANKIKDELNIDITTNEYFYKGITLHFFPAIERLKNDDQLTDNPLVSKINKENELAFKCASIFNEVVQKNYGKSFNEHELAYITLHFGTTFLNIKMS
jgi:transcriptional antiterminator